MASLPHLPPPVRSIDLVDDAESLARTTVRRPTSFMPRAALGASIGAACVIAAFTGVLLGHTRPSDAHAARAAHASVPVASARAPRVALVVEASEESTQLPILAPGKVNDTPVEGVAPKGTRALRRSGFGHMGADRVASGAAGRRAAPHRR